MTERKRFIIAVVFAFALHVPTVLAAHPIKIKCGDLWAFFAEKPKGVEWLDCKEAEGQKLATATYRVAGDKHRDIEALLVKKYGMGSLVKTATIWEPEKGQLGTIPSKRLARFNPEYSITVSMSAEIDIKDGQYKDRDQQSFYYFTVIIWDEI